jgi:Flp pilus assembly CpaE family ATPase
MPSLVTPAAIAPLQSPITAYVCTEQGAAVARELAANIGGDEPALFGGGVSGAARVADPAKASHILLTEIGNLPLSTACESVAEIHRTGARVVVFGQQNDITTYRAIVAAGAVDYFPFPVRSADIVESLTRAPANNPAAAPEAVAAPAAEPALRIGVTGSNGGVGASVLAQNLAYTLATQKKATKRTALIDGDLHFGSIACDLNRNPTPGMLEALSAPDRVDETFLNASMDQMSDTLSIYSAHLHHGGDDTRACEGMTRLIPTLSDHFDATILDAPRDLLLRKPALLKTLHRLVLVVPGGYSGVHAAVRMLDALKEAAPELTVIPVLTELRRDAGLSIKDMSKALSMELRYTLPRSDAAILRAHRAGAPLVARQPRAPYGKTVRALCAELAKPVAEAAPKAASRRGLFARMAG